MTIGLGFGRRRLVDKIVLENWSVKRPEEKRFSFNELLFVIQEMMNEEGKEYLQGAGTTLRGHHIFRSFVKHLLYRNLANYDSMILITAEKGVGKSSAAIMTAREWCRLIGIRFNPSRHIAYNNADVMNKIDMLNKFEPIICLSKNTKIRVLRDGKEHSIEIKKLLGKSDFKVLTYNRDLDTFEYQSPKKVVLNGKEVTWQLELENGIKINATPEHLFLTKNRGYVQLQHLNNDDEIVLQSRKCKICETEFLKRQWDVLTCSKDCSSINIKQQIPYRLSYPEKSRKWYRKYWKKKFDNDIEFRLRHNLHTRMAGAVKNFNYDYNKDSSFLELLGCKNYNNLRNHLERQFKSGMSWSNYGSEWSVDHIIPVSNFNLLNLNERKECYNYKNLQPLWKKENSSKGGKIDYK